MYRDEINCEWNGRERNKSFVQELITKTKWSLHPARNYIANLNSVEISYRFGWLLASLYLIVAIIICLAIYLKIHIISIILVYLPATIIYLAVFCFIIGFTIELYSFWRQKKELIKKVIIIAGTILSPVSLYIARCIFVYITGLEASNLLRSLILLSLIIQILLWFCTVAILILFIYLFSLFLIFNSILFDFGFWITSLVRNNPLYLFWFRKAKSPIDVEKNTKNFDNFKWFLLNRVTAAIFLVYIIIGFGLDSNVIVSESNSWVNVVENIIVNVDYRPSNYISECTNVPKDDYGLLIGYQKISIAHPKKSGGYSFTTNRCVFDLQATIN